MELPMQEQAKQTLKIARSISAGAAQFAGDIISADPVERMQQRQRGQTDIEPSLPFERTMGSAIYISQIAGGLLINQAQQAFERVKPLPSRTADFIGNAVFSLSPVENYKKWQEEQARRNEISVGRQKALRVVAKAKLGLPMEDYDELGNVKGNSWDEFRKVPHWVTYGDMELDDEQIEILEEKSLWSKED